MITLKCNRCGCEETHRDADVFIKNGWRSIIPKNITAWLCPACAVGLGKDSEKKSCYSLLKMTSYCVTKMQKAEAILGKIYSEVSEGTISEDTLNKLKYFLKNY